MIDKHGRPVPSATERELARFNVALADEEVRYVRRHVVEREHSFIVYEWQERLRGHFQTRGFWHTVEHVVVTHGARWVGGELALRMECVVIQSEITSDEYDAEVERAVRERTPH
jgi:hypothetical protein